MSDEPSLNHQQPSIEASAASAAGSSTLTTGNGKKCRKSEEVTLSAWLEATKAKGEAPVPASDPIFAYAEQIALPREFLSLAWSEFKARYMAEPMRGKKQKTYTDWRAVFRKAVREGWLKLWWLDGEHYALTTTGMQAQRLHATKEAA